MIQEKIAIEARADKERLASRIQELEDKVFLSAHPLWYTVKLLLHNYFAAFAWWQANQCDRVRWIQTGFTKGKLGILYGAIIDWLIKS